MSDNESFMYFSLIRCAMARVEAKYILLEVAGGNPKHRERVYCYELYHQMRCLQEQCALQNKFTINGEIDKRGPQEVDEDFNPDFVMHTPKSMKNNGCVVEVKVRSNSNSRVIDENGVLKDLKTITCMMNCYKYHNGALIFVDVDESNVIQILKSAKLPLLRRKANHIMVFFQSKDDPCKVSHKSLKEILEGEKQ